MFDENFWHKKVIPLQLEPLVLLYLILLKSFEYRVNSSFENPPFYTS